LKILYIQHVSVLGGSSRSLLELISKLPTDIDISVLCPKGEYADFLINQGIKVDTLIGMPQFDNGRISLYKGFRWLILLREFFYLPFLFFKMLELKKENYDIVHINEITQVYSLIFAKKILKSKIVLHTRIMMSTKKNLRYKVLLHIYKRYAEQIIAIDETVKSTLDDSLNVEVIHNGMSIENIHITKKKRDKFTVGIVANFQRYKGILEFINAANICINEKNLNINFLVFGAEYNNIKSFKEKVFQYFGFRENLEKIIKDKLSKYSLGGHFKLMGYVHKSDDIYNNIDLLTFPSHLNAVGRPVFEAGFYKIPSIVAIREPFDDTIIDGVTGVCIEERSAIDLANAIEKLYDDRELLKKMGENAYKQAHTLFNSKNNSQEVYKIYEDLLLTELE